MDEEKHDHLNMDHFNVFEMTVSLSASQLIIMTIKCNFNVKNGWGEILKQQQNSLKRGMRTSI